MENLIKQKYELLKDYLDEKQLRLYLGAEAKLLGRGGKSLVAKATGITRRKIARGVQELENPELLPKEGVRKSGAGRKKSIEKDPTLLRDLDQIIDPVTRGDPESLLRWTCKSLRKLQGALIEKGHKVSHQSIKNLLTEMGYSLQANRKSLEGTDNPDRDAQFNFINQLAKSFQSASDPVISVDSKKKELVGKFKNAGKEYQPKGQPEKVNVHDFEDKTLGKANPYGVYDIGRNEGWVSVGTDKDTAMFAVESIRRWWYSMGKPNYENTKRLLITADGGGSNGSRIRLWKREIQNLANETGLEISICHFPPGTSKWNKIEHRLFSYISQNWRGKPLVSHEVIINLIASTTTKKGLKVKCELDSNVYPKGIKVSDEEMKRLNIKRDDFHGEWNYTIAPN